MRSRIRAVHPADSFAQSARSGTRLVGSFASSLATSSSDNPIRCAKTMKATRLRTPRGYRRWPERLRTDRISPRSS
jgi:hypothetical protein